jgi:hypothetical protein
MASVLFDRGEPEKIPCEKTFAKNSSAQNFSEENHVSIVER